MSDREAFMSEVKSGNREAWESCQSGEWMAWVCSRAGLSRPLVVTALCRIWRELVERHVPTCMAEYAGGTELRPLRCCEVLESWARGEETVQEVREAGRAAERAFLDAGSGYITCEHALELARDIRRPTAIGAFADRCVAQIAAYAVGDHGDAGRPVQMACQVASLSAEYSKSASRAAEIIRETVPWEVVMEHGWADGRGSGVVCGARIFEYAKGCRKAFVPTAFIERGGKVYGDSERYGLDLFHPEIGWWHTDSGMSGGMFRRLYHPPAHPDPAHEYRERGLATALFGSAGGGGGSTPDRLHCGDLKDAGVTPGARKLGFLPPDIEYGQEG